MFAVLSCMVLLMLSASAKPTISVQVRKPASLTCPLKARLTRSLSQLGLSVSKRPELVVALGFKGGQAVLTIHRQGQRVLQRPLGRLKCSDLVATSALIVDRFVTDVGWSGTSSMEASTPDIPVVAPLRAPAEPLVGSAMPSDAGAAPPSPVLQDAGETQLGPAPLDSGVAPLSPAALDAAVGPQSPALPQDAGVAPPSSGLRSEAGGVDASAPLAAASPHDAGGSLVAASGEAPQVGAEVPAPEPPFAFDGSLGAGGALSNAGLAPSFSLSLALHRGLWRMGLLAEAPLLPVQTVTIQNRSAGTLTPWQIHALAALGPQTQWWRLHLSAQLAAGALFTQVVPKGTFNNQESRLGVLAELGAVGRAALAGPWGLVLALQAKGLFPLGSSAFGVEGTSAQFRTSPFNISLALEVGWSTR